MTTPKAPETLPARASLFDIEAQWLELLQRREDAEQESDERSKCVTCSGSGSENLAQPGDLPAHVLCGTCDGSGMLRSPRELAIEDADLAIAEHLSREITKVDGIIGFCRFLETITAAAKAERDRQAQRASRFEALLKQVKAGAQFAMEAAGRKRIDGQRGYLLVKGNGGVPPLVITDESLLPDECLRLHGSISLLAWRTLMDMAGVGAIEGADFKRVPDPAAIRAKLLEPCLRCGGRRFTEGSQYDPHTLGMGGRCEMCGGSGKAAVSGAHLAERGQHVEIKT